ncbi:MAG: hypothetical protein AVDCRST_MAG49-2521, partial [uncultured Thermomicrobiales bacterium]
CRPRTGRSPWRETPGTTPRSSSRLLAVRRGCPPEPRNLASGGISGVAGA